MIDKRAARAGGMPALQMDRQPGADRASKTRMLGTQLSEFHTGYRLYSTAALAQIPFEKNTNDFHFDTEIIIQFVLKKLRIAELPIPTFYGDEICHVNGMKYAWDVFSATIKARLCGIQLFYDRKFDVNPRAAGAQRQARISLPRNLSRSKPAAPAATSCNSAIGHMQCGGGIDGASFATSRRSISATTT